MPVFNRRVLGRLKGRGGFTLPEMAVMIAVVVFSITTIVYGLMMFSQRTVREKDRTYATQKAMQMMEELRGLVENESVPMGRLDDYDESTTYNDILTTLGATSPGDPFSGNGTRRYARRINVVPIKGDAFSRRVSVRVYLNATKEPLADIISVLSTSRKSYPSSQVYDLYVLALENVSSNWTTVSQMRTIFGSVLQDIETRNPGLRFRTHWISRLASGRDPHYAPDVSPTNIGTDAYASPNVYFYPSDRGRLYDPSLIQGRIRLNNGPGVQFVRDYALADTFNHAMRYVDELAQYNQWVTEARVQGQTPPEPSWRLLLDGMDASPVSFLSGPPPADYRNAIFINLHGEVMPLPPVRNYSDAAKDPATRPFQRAVSHPEKIWYQQSNPTVDIRVYTYVYLNPVDGYGAGTTDVTLFIPGLNTGNVVGVRRMAGDQATAYAWGDAQTPAHYTTRNIAAGPTGGSGVLITLKNSPLRHPAGPAGTGLPSDYRVCGLEYVPAQMVPPASPSEAYNTFFTENVYDLADPDLGHARNTARWVVRVNGLTNGVTSISTRLGPDSNDPWTYPNHSKTYVWVGNGPQFAPPWSEWYQYLGHPLHMPYEDGKAWLAYNFYFADPAKGNPADMVKWGNFWSAIDGYDPNITSQNRLIIDVTRYFQFVRKGLLRTGSVFTNMAGYPFFYLALGGEIKGQSSARSVLWDPQAGASATGRADEIIMENGSFVQFDEDRLIAWNYGQGANIHAPRWLGMSWLGEIYPDDAFAPNAPLMPAGWPGWVARGNLPTGADNFYRAKYRASPVNFGVANPSDPNSYNTPTLRVERRPFALSPTAFLNGGAQSASNDFYYKQRYEGTPSGNTTPNRTDAGVQLGKIFRYPLPPFQRIDREFTMNALANEEPLGLPPGQKFAGDIFSQERTTIYTLDTYYNSKFNSYGKLAAGMASLKVVDDRALVGRPAFYALMNGSAAVGLTGAIDMLKLSILGSIHTLLKAGEPLVPQAASRVVQLPRLLISSPTDDEPYPLPNSSSIPIAWSMDWKRWDGDPYTDAYAPNFSENIGVTYHAMYSRDGGTTWYYASAAPGAPERVPEIGRLSPFSRHAVASPVQWNISDPVAIPKGRYIVRVEAHRANQGLHYAYHQQQIYINR